MIPLRATGGNVLLKRVAADVHRSGLVVYGGKSSTVLQLGEVIGVGSRWTQDAQWFPPMVTPRRTTLDNGDWDSDWKPPDMSNRARARPPVFNDGHRGLLRNIVPGALVIYVQSRVYNVFEWEGEDILVYPGNWLLGVADDLSITEEELRRYERDDFDDAPHVTPKNLRGPAERATGETIRKFFEKRGLR